MGQMKPLHFARIINGKNYLVVIMVLVFRININGMDDLMVFSC